MTIIANLNGININYKVHGPDNQDSIILISGFSSDHKIWSLIIPFLVCTHKVIVFDNRAVGQTTDDGSNLDIELMANDTIQLLKYLGIERTHIIGHSMGGLIAQKIAIKNPPLADKLILINTVSHSFKTLEYALSTHSNIVSMGILDIQNLVKFILPWLFSNKFLENENHVNAFINSIINAPHIQSPENKMRQLQALVSADLRDEAPLINCDTLVISSEEDLLTPPLLNKDILKYIKNSKMLSIPGGHMSLIEHPELLAQTILTFLAERKRE